MDALSDILRVARLSGGVFFNAEFSAPWCIAGQMAPELCARLSLEIRAISIPYHYMSLMGRCTWHSPIDQPSGCAVVKSCCFPTMIFTWKSAATSVCTPVSAATVILDGGNKIVRTVRHGGGGEAAHMVCGFLGCDIALTTPIVSTTLPPLMILPVR